MTDTMIDINMAAVYVGIPVEALLEPNLERVFALFFFSHPNS